MGKAYFTALLFIVFVAIILVAIIFYWQQGSLKKGFYSRQKFLNHPHYKGKENLKIVCYESAQ